MCISRRILALAFSALVAAWAAPAEAAVIVTVNDAVIQPGGTTNLNVYIRSSDGTDLLNEFGFGFRITSGARRIEFVDPQSDLQLGEPDYIFAGDSAAVDTPFDVGFVSEDTVPNDTYVGNDLTTSGSNVSFAADKLLVVLELTASAAAPPIMGDTFTVELLTDSFTYFQSTEGRLEIDATSDLSGTVTVGAPVAAVPEPSSLVLFSGLAGLALVRCRRRRS
jgi:hypothetical protein